MLLISHNSLYILIYELCSVSILILLSTVFTVLVIIIDARLALSYIVAQLILSGYIYCLLCNITNKYFDGALLLLY